jgi:hypothetical protein
MWSPAVLRARRNPASLLPERLSLLFEPLLHRRADRVGVRTLISSFVDHVKRVELVVMVLLA